MHLYGIKISKEDILDARWLIHKFGDMVGMKPNVVKRELPILYSLYEKLRKVTGKAPTRVLINLIARPSSCPMCVCGKEQVHVFNADGSARGCNKNWNACAIFKQQVMQQRVETSRKIFGTDYPGQSAVVKKKRTKTNHRRYGVANVAQVSCVQKKMAATNIKRYGNANVFASPIIQQRIKESNLEHIGVEHHMHLPGMKAKVAATNIKRYGTKAPAQNKVVHDQMIATCIKRFGVENPFQSRVVNEKRLSTLHKNYGVTNPGQSNIVKRRIAATTLERFGAENVFASDYGKQRIKETMQERYGVDHALQHPAFFLKQQSSAYKYKSIKLNGRIVKVQGFEKTALRFILDKGVKSKRITVGMEGTVPRIIYQFRGKTRAYFPDIMIDDNHIVEVKSTWTLYRSVQQLHIAQAKARECLAQGLKFNLILVIGRTNGKQIAHLLPKRWLTMTQSQIICYVNRLTSL